MDAMDKVVERMEADIMISLVEGVAGMLNLPMEVVVDSRRCEVFVAVSVMWVMQIEAGEVILMVVWQRRPALLRRL